VAIWLSIAGFLLFLALWGAAWRKQPNLAFGMSIGLAITAVVAAFARPSEMHDVPIWLPPLPFAMVAIALLGFGVWAWAVGRKR